MSRSSSVSTVTPSTSCMSTRTPSTRYKIEAKPGQSFQFTVAVPGKVDVELHELNKTVATITVR